MASCALTERAGQVFKRLPYDTRANYGLAKAELKNRFEPESQKILYQTKLQTQVKQKVSEEVEEDARAVALTAVQRLSDLKMILERMEQMETKLKEIHQPTSRGFSHSRGQRNAGRSGMLELWW